MERIKAFTTKKGTAKFQIIFGAVFFAIAITLFITDWLGEDKIEWITVTFILQSILFIFLGYNNMSFSKYYIEWDDEQLNFFLPPGKSIESINIGEIESVSINLFKVSLKLSEGTKILKLDGLSFKDIRRIKEKFEAIKANIEPAVVYQ